MSLLQIMARSVKVNQHLTEKLIADHVGLNKTVGKLF